MVVYIFVRTDSCSYPGTQMPGLKGLPRENETREVLEGHLLNAPIEPIDLSYVKHAPRPTFFANDSSSCQDSLPA